MSICENEGPLKKSELALLSSKTVPQHEILRDKKMKVPRMLK